MYPMARPARSLLRQTLDAVRATVGRRIRAETAGGRLHGRALVLARTVWLTVAALTGALFVTGIWAQIGQVRGPCPPRVCVNGQLPPDVARAFAALHLAVGFYGGYELGRNFLSWFYDWMAAYLTDKELTFEGVRQGKRLRLGVVTTIDGEAA